MDRAELESYLQDRLRWLAENLEGDAARRREEIERAVAAFKAEKWTLYIRLVTPYFCNDPRPELVEALRAEASESVARRMALADHDEALDFLLEHI